MKNDESATHGRIKDYYDSVYYRGVSREVVTTSHYRSMAKRLGVTEGQQVLDIACGTGAWLLAVEERGARPYGIDISEKVIAICKNVMPGGEFRVGVAESLPFDDNRFDIVTCFGSLEHFLDPNAALRQMLRVARDNAYILILVPNAGFLTRRLGLFAGTHQASVKEDVRTIQEWSRLFTKVGLGVENQWRDLHILSKPWILRKPWYLVPVRVLQAISLVFWPLSWQYQVYFVCRKRWSCSDSSQKVMNC